MCLRHFFPLALLVVCSGCTLPVGPDIDATRSEVVYGTDNRAEAYEHPNTTLSAIAENSMAAIVPAFALLAEPSGGYVIDSITLAQEKGLCDGEAFGDQPSASKCSAVLIDDDLLVTAGHCYRSVEENPLDCQSDRYVFDYRLVAPNTLATIDADDVYSCRSVEARVLVGNIDFSLVRLDRPVVGRTPISSFLNATAIDVDDAVALVGFGSGLPAKVQDSAQVIDTRRCSTDAFVTNVDAFGGDSGAGIFTPTGDFVGILISGEQDYVLDGACSRVRVLDEADGAEQVLYAQTIASFACLATPDAPFCDATTCDSSRCIPSAWSCAEVDFGDGSFCNLGCGAFDPDCMDATLFKASNDPTCDTTPMPPPPTSLVLKGTCAILPGRGSAFPWSMLLFVALFGWRTRR